MFRDSKKLAPLRWLTALASISILASAPLVLLSGEVAHAQTDEELFEQKAEWQERYRDLLRDAARLERNASAARENYTRAQKRNYPRGGARQQFLVDEKEATDGLADVQQQIANLKSQAQREGVMPGWLYEVEDEDFSSYSEPASPDGGLDASDDEDDADDREGRNPLYLDDDEEDGDR